MPLVGAMVRFSVSESEIAALVRFLTRRTEGGLWMVPLEAAHRDELRFRRTARPFLRRLTYGEQPLHWGLLPAPEKSGDSDVMPPAARISVRRVRAASGSNATPDTTQPLLSVDPDLNGLIVLILSEPSGPSRRREGILATRDPLHPAPKAPATDIEKAGASKPTEKMEMLSDTESDAARENEVQRLASALRSELVEKCARRLRRKGERKGGRWYVPD